MCSSLLCSSLPHGLYHMPLCTYVMIVQRGGTAHLFAHISCPSIAGTSAMPHATVWWPRHASLCLLSPGAARATNSHTSCVPGPPPGGRADLFMCLPCLMSLMCLYLLFPSTHPGSLGTVSRCEMYPSAGMLWHRLTEFQHHHLVANTHQPAHPQCPAMLLQ